MDMIGFLLKIFYNVFYGEFCSCFNFVSDSGISARDYLDNLFTDEDKGNYLIYFIKGFVLQHV